MLIGPIEAGTNRSLNAKKTINGIIINTIAFRFLN